MIKEELQKNIAIIKDIEIKLSQLKANFMTLQDSYDSEIEAEINYDYTKLLNKYPGNIQVIKSYIDFIRLIQSKKLSEQFELEDIDNWYTELSLIFKDELDINIEKLYFLFNVMNKEVEAKVQFNSLKLKTLDNLNEIENYMSEFE